MKSKQDLDLFDIEPVFGDQYHIVKKGVIAVWTGMVPDLHNQSSPPLYKPDRVLYPGDTFQSVNTCSALRLSYVESLLTIEDYSIKKSPIDCMSEFEELKELPTKFRIPRVLRKFMAHGLIQTFLIRGKPYVKFPLSVKDLCICCWMSRDSYYNHSMPFELEKYPGGRETGGLYLSRDDCDRALRLPLP